MITLTTRQSTRSDLSHNISNYAHQMASSIASSCSTNEFCQKLAAYVIPTCEKLSGAAGCWCGNHEAFYRCSICAAGLTEEQTSQETPYPFRDFEESCRIYEQLVENSTSVMELPIRTMTASSTTGLSTTARATPSNVSGEINKLPVGMIIGGVLGAVFGLLLVFVGVRYAERFIRRRGSKQSSQSNYYYQSVQYSGESALNRHLSRIVYNSPYECITPRPVSGNAQPDSTHVITSVESPEPISPPPYQSSSHQPHYYPLDRKSRVAG